MLIVLIAGLIEIKIWAWVFLSEDTSKTPAHWLRTGQLGFPWKEVRFHERPGWLLLPFFGSGVRDEDEGVAVCDSRRPRAVCRRCKFILNHCFCARWVSGGVYDGNNRL